MKKIFSVILLLILCLSFFGCGKQEGKNSVPIEISIQELFDAYDSKKKFILAIVNSEDENKKDTMLSSLGNYQTTYNNMVYYIDTTDLSDLEKEFIELLLGVDSKEYYYFIISNKEVEGAYNNFKSLSDVKENLKNNDFDELDMERITEERNKSYKEGTKALESGYITTAYNSLKNSLPKEEAKETLKKDSFNILNNWEVLEENKNNCRYYGIYFVNETDQFLVSTYDGECSKFSKDLLSPKRYNYYIKDSTIYATSVSNNKKDEISYKIIDNSKDFLKIDDGKREYELNVVGD